MISHFGGSRCLATQSDGDVTYAGETLGQDWKDWIIAYALEVEAKQLIDS